MKASKFTKAQKAFVLKQGRRTNARGIDLSQGLDQPSDPFPLEEALWRLAARRNAAVEGA